MSAAQESGFAVMSDGNIDMRTVSESRRAAVVNWLVVTAGIFIFNWHTDADIEKMWREHCGASEVVYVRVSQLKAA